MKPVTSKKQALKVLLRELSISDLTRDMKKHIDYFNITCEFDFLKLLGYLFVMSSNDDIDYANKKSEISSLINERTDVSDCDDPLEKIAKRRLVLDHTNEIARLSTLDITMRSQSSLSERTKFTISYLFAKKEISILGDQNDPDRRVYLGVLPTFKIAKDIINLFYGYYEKKDATYIGDKQSAVVSVLSQWELFGDAQFKKIDSRRAVLLFNALDICHFQVPFADHSVEFHGRDSKANAPKYSEDEVANIIDLMRKLREIYLNMGCLYFHCKAGQGRSSFIAVLFLCLNYRPWQVFHDNGELDVLATIQRVHAGVKSDRNVVDDLSPYRLAGLYFLVDKYIQYEKTRDLEQQSDISYRQTGAHNQNISEDFDDYDSAHSYSL